MTICWTAKVLRYECLDIVPVVSFFSQVENPMFFDSKARSRPPSVSSQMTPPRYSLKGWSRCSNLMKFLQNKDEICFI